MTTYSILITTYECYGNGLSFIRENLKSVISQTYRPIQCIVSDHSKDDNIENYIKSVESNGVDIVYLRYTENYGNPCYNWNNALKYATGKYIHYFAMDDKLSSPESIQTIVSFMDSNSSKWIACSHIGTPTDGDMFIPSWNNNILTYNTISGPSAVVIHESLKHVTLDPQFIWFLDLDWYYRLWLEAGPPQILNIVVWINRLHMNQLTHKVCDTDRQNIETSRMHAKYGNPFPTS